MRLRIITLFFISLLISACSKNEEQTKENRSIAQNQHKATVMEVIPVSAYTYLHVTENGKDYWIAAPRGDFKVGEVIVYSNYMEMKNFESKELKKTFESILFIDNASVKLGEGIMNEPMKPTINKEEIKIEPIKDGVTIAQIFADPQKYSNKVVKVKGKVVKINSGIMKKNWIHLQDGTSYQDNYDLTITTNDLVRNGDVVVFEGKIALNKDFGYGYSYKVIMEDAKPSKNL